LLQLHRYIKWILEGCNKCFDQLPAGFQALFKAGQHLAVALKLLTQVLRLLDASSPPLGSDQSPLGADKSYLIARMYVPSLRLS
jgi:hypothetical protein